MFKYRMSTVRDHYLTLVVFPTLVVLFTDNLTIYSSRILCLSSCLSSCHPVILSSCHPVTIAERSAILLVLIIKLTQKTRRRVWRGRDMEVEIGKGLIGEGGCE
jgi:hypothetical protein